MKSRKAFTLIETLVVTAIIVVLFGIVYVATGSAREKARQAMCVSNLHQLDTALQLYLQDYGAEDNPKLMAKIPFDPDKTLAPYGGNRSKYQCLDENISAPGHTDYLWGIVQDPALPIEPSTEWLFQQCGSQMVIWSDDNHNFLDPNLPPNPRTFWLLSRLDGSITTGYYNTLDNLTFNNPCFQKQ